MKRRALRVVLVGLTACVGLALTARADAYPADRQAAPPESGAGSAPLNAETSGTSKERLRGLLFELDRQAAVLEQSRDPEAVAEAAKSRAAFVSAIQAVGRMSEEEAADLLVQLPVLVSGMSIVGAGSGAHAQAAATPMPQITQSDADELELFRAELDQLFVHYGTWSYLVPNDDQFAGFIQDGRDLVAGLTYEDLAAIQGELSSIPNWQEALAPDLAAYVAPSGVPDGPVDGSVVPRTASKHVLDSVGSVPLSDGAQVMGTYTPYRRATIDMGPQCSVEVFSLTLPQLEARIIAESVLRYVALALKFGGEIAPKDIKITVLGVTIDIPNPYTLLILIARAVVNRVADGLAAELSVNTYCAATVHWTQLVQHAQSEIDRSQDILYQELDFYNRMTERYNALDFTERELWKMQLQLAIEENLLLDAPKADGSDENRIALFQFTDTVCFNPEELLPTPVPPFDTPVAPTPVDPLLDPCHDQAALGPSTCGSPIDPPDRYVPLPTLAAFVGPADPREECGLSLVRRLVAETIVHNQQAGQNVHNAPNLLAAGDIFLANHQYGQAYIRFRQAYQAAVKPDPSPNSR